MYVWVWVPKPNKPGKMRPITQPNKADIIVMDALSLFFNLLNGVFEDIAHFSWLSEKTLTLLLLVRNWAPVYIRNRC